MKDTKTNNTAVRAKGPDTAYRMRKALIKRAALAKRPDTEDDPFGYGTEQAELAEEDALRRISDGVYQAPAAARRSYAGTHTNTFKDGAADAAVPSFGMQETAKAMPEEGRKILIARQQKQVFQKASGNITEKGTGIGRRIKDAAVSVKERISDLFMLLMAGGSISAVLIILICSIGLAVGSSFGIFFSGEASGSGLSMQEAVRDINEEYGERIRKIKERGYYDEIEMSGSSALWREVLSVYAVKISTDPDDPMDVVSLNEEKMEILKEVFWGMNDIRTSIEVYYEPIEHEVIDEEGYTVIEIKQIERTVLHITVTHKTAAEMAERYGFTDEQKAILAQLLDGSNAFLWPAVLYGIHAGSTAIVEVARTQIGNVGGEPYWSWYGYSSRVEWCSCFVSWCANECGYIEAGLVPKHAGPPTAVSFYKSRDQWLSGNAEPAPGMLIFFDWDNKGRSGDQNGLADHIGIVEKVEDGWVWTIEGNTSDSVARRKYRLGHYEILGYGFPFLILFNQLFSTNLRLTIAAA